MKKPEFITFTGIDDRTCLGKADQLARRYPIEWGILFSYNNKDARYPSLQTIDEAMQITGKKSVHLCGRASREFHKKASLPEIVYKNLSKIDRMQINGFDYLPYGYFHGVFLISQCKEFNHCSSGYQLFDTSGGCGKFPDAIPKPKTNGLVGYAGGIGPETVEKYLKLIESDNCFWIDMEGKVRTNGWFDLNKVEQVCEIVYGPATL